MSFDLPPGLIDQIGDLQIDEHSYQLVPPLIGRQMSVSFREIASQIAPESDFDQFLFLEKIRCQAVIHVMAVVGYLIRQIHQLTLQRGLLLGTELIRNGMVEAGLVLHDPFRRFGREMAEKPG